MLNNLATNVRDVIKGLVTMLVGAIFHPNFLLLAAFIAAVFAAHRTWGTTGALWTGAVLAMLLALANAGEKK